MQTKKLLLSIEDLVEFCSINNFCYFNSNETGYQLAVRVPAEFSSEEEETDELLLFGKTRAFHVGRNRNGSSVTKEAATKAMKKMAYKPVLANFCEIDGVKDFTSHDFYIDDDGKQVFVEHQIGCITADETYFEYDEELDKEFVCARIAIPRIYTDACEIIERKNGTKVSVELLIHEMSYSAKEKTLELLDVSVRGLTCLGVNPDTGKEVGEGMLGSNVTIEDFSVKNNSVFNNYNDYSTQKRLVEILEKMSDKLDAMTFSDSNNTNVKGGEKENMKFDELLEKYQITADDVDFEYEGMSDEELEAKFEEVFGKGEGDGGEPGEPEGDPIVEIESVKPEKYSVIMSDGTSKEFTLSLSDIQYALYDLVNATYSETDNTYYSVTVYENNTLVMQDWWNNKAYRQSYSREEDSFSLIGDRIEVFHNWLSAEEEAALAEMKSNYSLLEEKVNTYELNEARKEKSDVLNQEKYSILSEVKEFQNLKENMDNYSLDALTKEVKAIHSDFVSEHPEVFNFSQNTKPRNKVSYGFNFDQEKKPYGNLFNN